MGIFLFSAFVVACSKPALGESAEKKKESLRTQYLAYFGTSARGNNNTNGIFVYRFDARTGKMAEIGLAADVINPSFISVHPNNKHLYAVTRDPDGQGVVNAFEINHATGELKELNHVSSKGSPCHLNVDATGRMLAVANYHAGSTLSYPIHEDGTLGKATSVMKHQGSSINKKRQDGPHPHSVNFSPDNRFLISADLGADKLYVYLTDPATARIKPNDPLTVRIKPGGGPRHFTFHPSSQFCYAINELGNTITAFRWDVEYGTMKEMQMISTLPEGFNESNTTAEVLVHPSGKFLYGSNRGHDSIAVFSIDPASGKLTIIEHTPTQGRTPRNFNLDPSGKYLFAENQGSDTVVTFSINQQTGKLTPTGQVLHIPYPVCLRWVPLN
jgi:6-phosphogluconolactonase